MSDFIPAPEPISLPIGKSPLSVWLVGRGPLPTVWFIYDRMDSNLLNTMSFVERAALRALCQEAIRMIDALEVTE